MGLSVNAQDASVRVQDSRTVERCISVPFKKTDRNHSLRLFREDGKPLHGRVLGERPGQIHICKVLRLTEILRLKQLLQKNDLSSLLRRLPDQAFRFLQILFPVPGTAHLGHCRRHLSHTVSSWSLSLSGHSGNRPDIPGAARLFSPDSFQKFLQYPLRQDDNKNVWRSR